MKQLAIVGDEVNYDKIAEYFKNLGAKNPHKFKFNDRNSVYTINKDNHVECIDKRFTDTYNVKFITELTNRNNDVKIINVTLNVQLYNKLKYLGILGDNKVRKYNVGASNYSSNEHLIQPWTLWLDYPNLTPFDHDILKRVLREKITDGRILDYQKIIHICEERIRQLNVLNETNNEHN